ncbi:Leucine-rich repeat-containing protein 46 [Hondaea fermentalgiana]|uniref:Leucine-rich repeat-containing protein 46 n=1 Tax=Hondaea fermentalgiana TaxID=2315210 RepID=A0A2R5G7S2_9STRA|nr:Leucine-rich repeat-containing protein 46 [Hondaea fermentalgiana]|eukprot:GBG24533.1 Leucine-rich repeat-containing protein 46 [Hondaea fermentalgiana]
MSYRTPDRDESKEAVPETVTPTMAESATADGTLEVASESATRISTAKKEADAVMAEMTESFDRELLPQTRMTFRRITELCLSKADRDAQSTNPDAVAEKLLNIRTARLDWQGFTEIDSLEALTNIRELHLQFNRIRRIENLDFHMRLRFLALGHNEIEHIENLVHLRSLEVLDLNHNRIEVLDLTALPPSLRNLDLRGNPCTSVSEYQSRICAKMPQLVYLDAIAIRNERKSMDRSGGDQRDQELEERVELKPLRSARSGPPSATHRALIKRKAPTVE